MRKKLPYILQKTSQVEGEENGIAEENERKGKREEAKQKTEIQKQKNPEVNKQPFLLCMHAK